MSETSLKLPTFDGKDANFSMFWMRFKAYAGVKGFLQALQQDPDEDMPLDEAVVLDPNDAQEALQIAAKKRNALAVASFTMAFTTQTLMMYVQRATTEYWPGGLSHLIVRALFARYRPRDNISHVELRMMLNKVTMKNGDSPEKLFEQLSEIENAYNNNGMHVDEADLMAIVFTEAPKNYQSVLSAVQLERGNKLSLGDLEAAMFQVWRQGNAVKNREEEKEEVALAAVEGKKCWICGSVDHLSRTCPEKKKEHNQGGNGGNKCGHCGRLHPSDKCWSLPENADQRPSWYNTKANEVGAAAIGTSSKSTAKSIEYMLAGIGIQKDLKNIEDPEIWIADSGTTSHTTPHSMGMVNLYKAEAGDTITMGNGWDTETASMIGEVPGMMCDHHGNQVGPVRLGEVKLLPNGKYNLFSVTKLMKNGWSMSGDKTGMRLVKDGMKIVFDIVIPTKEGILYAMYMQRRVVEPVKELSGRNEVKTSNEEVQKTPVKKIKDGMIPNSLNPSWKSTKGVEKAVSRGELSVCVACAQTDTKHNKVQCKKELKKVSSVKHKKVCMKEEKTSAYEKNMKEESSKDVIKSKNEEENSEVNQSSNSTKELEFVCVGANVGMKEQGREVFAPTEQQNIDNKEAPQKETNKKSEESGLEKTDDDESTKTMDGELNGTHTKVMCDDDQCNWNKVGVGTKKKTSRSSEGLSQLQGESVGAPSFVHAESKETIGSKSTIETVSRHERDDVKLTIPSNSTGYATDRLQHARGHNAPNGRTTKHAYTVEVRDYEANSTMRKQGEPRTEGKVRRTQPFASQDHKRTKMKDLQGNQLNGKEVHGKTKKMGGTSWKAIPDMVV
jgi:hypothetical protein